MRLGSGISLLLSSPPLLFPSTTRKMGRHAPLLLGGFALLGAGLFIFAETSGYIEQKAISFLRDDFVEGFIAAGDRRRGSVSTIYIISVLPIYLRIPLLFLFFLCTPFADATFRYDGIFIPRAFLRTLASGFNILLMKYWAQSLVASWRTWRQGSSAGWLNLHLVYMGGVFLLATMSLQLRHKTMLIPLLCVLAAHGVSVRDQRAKVAGTAAMALLVLANLVKLFGDW